MKSVIRLSLLAAVGSMVFAAAENADARGCFLKKLFDRGGCCSPCEPSCCEPEPSCDCGAPVADCGCGGAVVTGEVVGSDCGCGGTVTSGEVMSDGVIIHESAGEPTEASPSDATPAVPEPPAADDAGEAAAEAADASA